MIHTFVHSKNLVKCNNMNIKIREMRTYRAPYLTCN